MANRIIVFFGIGTAIFLFLYLFQFTIPYEDASILFSYAENFSNSGTISYYPKGMPAEGASDFLFLILVSLLFKIGLPIFFSAVLLNFLGALTAIYSFHKLSNKNSLLFLLSIILFFLLPQIIAGILGYATIFYAGITLLVITFFLNKNSKLFYIFCAIHFLTRPIEGFVSISLVLFYFYKIKNSSNQKHELKFLIVYFLLPISCFWVWRTYYFGHFLPLPYYIKTNFEKWLFFFNKDSIYFHYKLFFPFCLSIFLVFLPCFFLKTKIIFDFWAICISLILLPIFLYSTADLDMNFALRYQILPFLGLMILGLYYSYSNILLKTLFFLSFLLPLVNLSSDQWLRAREFDWNNMYFIGDRIFKSNKGEGNLATTESGIIPWKTKMKTMDLWGLNTPQLTDKLPTDEELKIFKPDIIVIHPKNDDLSYLKERVHDKILEKNWENMTTVVFQFAYKSQNYDCFLVPYDLRSYDPKYSRPWFSLILDNRYGKATFSNRKDLFFIRKDFKFYFQTIKILQEYGSIPYPQY